MKIVNIILTSQNGGAEQVFLDYISVLKDLGHDILAITKEDAPYANQVLDLGVEVKKIKNSFGYHDILAVKKIRNIIEEFKADAVIAHVGRSVVLTKKALRKIKDKKIILVAVNHSMNVKRSICADLIFNVNKEIFYRTAEYGKSARESFVISNAIDLSNDDTRISELNLSNKSEIIVGTMARLDDKKGVDYLIRAIKELEKSDKKFHLKIAGEGSFKTKLQSLVKDLDLEKKVEFCGWVKDKKEFFESIDIFCLASFEETFGLVLLEAMKYKKPIISTDTNGAREILRNKIDGIVIALNPLESLKDRISAAINQVIENDEIAQKMVIDANLRVREKFSHDALKMKMREVFGEG